MKDWENVSAQTLTTTIEDLIVRFCEPKSVKDKSKEDKLFQSKNRIPRVVRFWLRKKSLASKALMRVKTVKGCNRLKEKIN